jgi:predicted nucleic acid binding AN1-type Zn finger protein
MIFSNKVSHQTVYPTLYLNRVRLKEVDEHKHIGLILSKNLSWRKHITEICKKANKHLDVINIKWIIIVKGFYQCRVISKKLYVTFNININVININ